VFLYGRSLALLSGETEAIRRLIAVLSQSLKRSFPRTIYIALAILYICLGEYENDLSYQSCRFNVPGILGSNSAALAELVEPW
jgi:hypothetical protein